MKKLSTLACDASDADGCKPCWAVCGSSRLCVIWAFSTASSGQARWLMNGLHRSAVPCRRLPV